MQPDDWQNGRSLKEKSSWCGFPMEERGICQQKGCLEISLELDKTENTNNRIIEKKMKIKKMMMAALAALMVPAAVWAQESDDNGVYAELNADLVSSYIWHGP